jgi:uncharacterized protein (DUF433 family)
MISHQEVLGDFSYLTEEDILACLSYPERLPCLSYSDA